VLPEDLLSLLPVGSDRFSHFNLLFDRMLTKSVRRGGYIVGRAIRETGQALDRLGSALQGNLAYKEQCTHH